MSTNELGAATIFHLRGKGGRSVYLHPFNEPRQFIEALTNGRVEGRYGENPRLARSPAFGAGFTG